MQELVLSGEINLTGTITDIAFDYTQTPYDNALFYNFELYLCHTSLDELTINFNDNYDGNTPVLVSEANPFNITIPDDGWFSFPDVTTFFYNGVDNLIVELRWQDDNDIDVYNYGFDTGSNRALGTKFYNGETGSLSTKLNRMYLTIDMDNTIQSKSFGMIKALF